MSAKEVFGVPAASACDRLEMSYGFAAAHDGVVLAAVFNPIEEIGEVSSGVGCGNVRHDIRLSDWRASVKPSTPFPPGP